MTLLDILSSDSTIVDLKGETKEDIIAELVNSLALDDAITDREKVLQAVLEREKIMSTGIGDGIAIPHGKSDAKPHAEPDAEAHAAHTEPHTEPDIEPNAEPDACSWHGPSVGGQRGRQRHRRQDRRRHARVVARGGVRRQNAHRQGRGRQIHGAGRGQGAALLQGWQGLQAGAARADAAPWQGQRL